MVIKVKVLLSVVFIFFGFFLLAVEIVGIRTADPFEPTVTGWIILVVLGVAAIGLISLGARLIFRKLLRK
jgi:hypothetical protein